MFKKLLLTTLVSSIALSPAMATLQQDQPEFTAHPRVLKRFPDATPLAIVVEGNAFPEFLNQYFVNRLTSDDAKRFALVSKDACNLVDGRPHLRLNRQGVGIAEMLQVFRTKRNLTSLNLGASKNVSAAVFFNIPKLFPYLRSLSIAHTQGAVIGFRADDTNIYDRHTALSVRNLLDGIGSQLTHLNMNASFRTREDAVEAISLVTQQCTNLLSLEMSYCSVTDTHLENIGKSCTRLQYLTLPYTGVTELGTKHLANCHELAHIETMRELSENTAKLLAKNCPNLKQFRLGGGSGDATLCFISEHCTNVESLSLRGQHFTNTSIGILAEHFKNLTKLVCYQTEITDEGLPVIAKNFPGLQILIVKGFKGTREGLVKLKDARPNLNVTNTENNGLIDIIESSINR